MVLLLTVDPTVALRVDLLVDLLVDHMVRRVMDRTRPLFPILRTASLPVTTEMNPHILVVLLPVMVLIGDIRIPVMMRTSTQSIRNILVVVRKMVAGMMATRSRNGLGLGTNGTRIGLSRRRWGVLGVRGIRISSRSCK